MKRNIQRRRLCDKCNRGKGSPQGSVVGHGGNYRSQCNYEPIEIRVKSDTYVAGWKREAIFELRIGQLWTQADRKRVGGKMKEN